MVPPLHRRSANSSPPRVTIADLPPEIINAIALEVQLAPRYNPFLGLEDQDILNHAGGPAGIMAMMQAAIFGGFVPPPPLNPNPAGLNPGPGGAPPPLIPHHNANLNLNPAPRPPPATPAAAQANDSDSDGPPPLEDDDSLPGPHNLFNFNFRINPFVLTPPAETTQPLNSGSSGATPSAVPLASTSSAPPVPTTSTSTSATASTSASASTPSTSTRRAATSAGGYWANRPAGAESDDEGPPPLEDDVLVPPPARTAPPTPARAPAQAPRPGGFWANRPEEDSDSDGPPPLEDIDDPPTNRPSAPAGASTATSRATAAPAAAPTQRAPPPARAPAPVAFPPARASTSARPVPGGFWANRSALVDSDSDSDGPPPLEDDDSLPTPAQVSAPAPPPAPTGPFSFNFSNLAFLGGGAATAGPTAAAAIATATGLRSGPAAGATANGSGAAANGVAAGRMPMEEDEEDEEDDEDDYGDDDDEEDYDDDEDDYDDEDEDEDEDRLFPLGLPINSMLPLALVSRPFLHAARKLLYSKIRIKSTWQASILLRSLSTPEHAARHALESAEGVLPNALARMVRMLFFSQDTTDTAGDISLGRGGGSNYLDIIKLCTMVEDLTVGMTFLKEATRQYLAALRELTRLKRIALSGSLDTDKGCLVTSARVYDLMRNSWKDLDHLVIFNLISSEDGPSAEDDEFWCDRADELRLEKLKDPSVVPRKGLKWLELVSPDVPFTELEPLLHYSRKSLRTVYLEHPTNTLSRYGLASTILSFGIGLTELKLSVTKDWHPIANSANRPPYPKAGPTHIRGKPGHNLLSAISKYPFFLDAVVFHMPNLVTLAWEGQLASANIFLHFPPKLAHITWTDCLTIQPRALSRVLNKTYNITETIPGLNGLPSTKRTSKVPVARGLCCINVSNDDYQWSDYDVNALMDTMNERGAKLTLSSATHPAGLFGPGDM